MTDVFLNVEKYHERSWPGVEWVSFRKPSTLFVYIVPSYIYRLVGQTGFDFWKSQLFGPLQSSLYSNNNNHDCEMVLLAFLLFQKAGCNLRLVKQVNEWSLWKVESALTHSVVTAFCPVGKAFLLSTSHIEVFGFTPIAVTKSTLFVQEVGFHPFATRPPASLDLHMEIGSYWNHFLTHLVTLGVSISPFLCLNGVSVPVSLRVAGNWHLSWTWLDLLNPPFIRSSEFGEVMSWLLGQSLFVVNSSMDTFLKLCGNVPVMLFVNLSASCHGSRQRSAVCWQCSVFDDGGHLPCHPPWTIDPRRRALWMTAQRPVLICSDSADLPETEIPVSFY